MTCSKIIDQLHNNNSIAFIVIEKCYFILFVFNDNFNTLTYS